MMVYDTSRYTQSIDAIDVTSVTLSRLNSINAITVTQDADWMLNFCWSVPLEFLWSFLAHND